MNSRRIILKIYYAIKDNYYIFRIRKRIRFVRLKRVITIEVLL